MRPFNENNKLLKLHLYVCGPLFLKVLSFEILALVPLIDMSYILFVFQLLCKILMLFKSKSYRGFLTLLF